MEGTNEYYDYMTAQHQNQPDEGGMLKAARKHFSKLGGMFILGTIIIYAVQLIPLALVNIISPGLLYDPDIAMAFSMIPMYLIGMPLLILLVRTVPADRIEKRPIKAGSFVLAAIMCFAIMYVSNIVGNIITAIIGMLKGSLVQNQLLEVTGAVSIWTMVIYMVICAPIMEEYIFRKLIVDRAVRYGQGTAVILSGLMFGLFHGNLNQFAYAFTLGIFLAFLYVKTGNLKITIALHMMINFMGGVATTLLTRAIDLDEYLDIVSRMDMDSMMVYLSENLIPLIAYGVLIIFVFGMMIAGGVLLIVFLVKKRFTLNRGAVVIPKGKRFRTVILNLGMMLYSLFWIGMIIYQLLA